MPATLIDGKAVAASVRAKVKAEIASLGLAPRLDVVLVGDDPASKVYVNMKDVACGDVGIKSVKHMLPASVTQEELFSLIRKLNADGSVDGVLVQLPLPDHLNEQAAIDAIDPAKDVDGLNHVSLGMFFSGLPGLRPCTPLGVMALLDSINYNYRGKRAVVVGRSKLVGRPLAVLLSERDCTVTVCHSKTRDLAAETRRAELLVVAVGKPKLVTADMVSDGAVVVDVGVNRTDKGIVGDVDFAAVAAKAAYITPVPGGVGPMTVAMLMRNTLDAAKARRK